MGSATVPVSVDGRVLRLSNLDKVLYPRAGFTKAEVIDYYTAVSAALLPRLARRPVTLRRYPDGADTEGFFEKNAARDAPNWLPTVRLPTRHAHRGSAGTDFVLIEDLPTLVWVANLAALELHIPQWTITDDGHRQPPDLLVFDLDPGPPATVVHCCVVAMALREALTADGLSAWPKTSGAKGLQLYVPVTTSRDQDTSHYAHMLALRLAREQPNLIVATMAKAARTGKVFIDWSQNHPAKTTIAAYSLRARTQPTVSTPITWREVQACRRPADLTFTAADARRRLAEGGDLLHDLDRQHAPLPEL